MVPLAPDPRTGFLESTGKHAFNAVMKMRALELAHENVTVRSELPDIPAICKGLGISHNTFYAHLQQDEEFKRQWEEVLDLCEHELVKTMYANGRRPNGYMDRITWLRAHRPGKWNPDYKINISTDSGQAKGLIGLASTAIEAEIVASPTVIDAPSAQSPVIRPSESPK